MKEGIRLTKGSLIALYVVFAVLGAFVAAITYYRYTSIARGLIGLALLYLILNRNAFQNLYEPIEALLLHSNKIKDFSLTFVLGTISTWAVIQAAEPVILYLRR